MIYVLKIDDDFIDRYTNEVGLDKKIKYGEMYLSVSEESDIFDNKYISLIAKCEKQKEITEIEDIEIDEEYLVYNKDKESILFLSTFPDIKKIFDYEFITLDDFSIVNHW